MAEAASPTLNTGAMRAILEKRMMNLLPFRVRRLVRTTDRQAPCLRWGPIFGGVPEAASPVRTSWCHLAWSTDDGFRDSLVRVARAVVGPYCLVLGPQDHLYSGSANAM